MRTINLDILNEGKFGLTPVMGAYYAEAAKVCLLQSGHQSGVILKIEGAFLEEIELIWDIPLPKKQLNKWKEPKNYCNFGAVGLSILIANALLGHKYFEEGRQGTGLDFWMGNSFDGEEILQQIQKEEKFEISGIFKENRQNSVKMRVEKKRKQLDAPGKSDLPAWISVVEFSTPKSKFVKK